MNAMERLRNWQKTSRKSDAQVADLLHVNRSTISRVVRGINKLSIADQIALEEFTGITPAEWAEYYEKRARADTAAKTPNAKKTQALGPPHDRPSPSDPAARPK